MIEVPNHIAQKVKSIPAAQHHEIAEWVALKEYGGGRNAVAFRNQNGKFVYVRYCPHFTGVNVFENFYENIMDMECEECATGIMKKKNKERKNPPLANYDAKVNDPSFREQVADLNQNMTLYEKLESEKKVDNELRKIEREKQKKEKQDIEDKALAIHKANTNKPANRNFTDEQILHFLTNAAK